MSIPQYLMGQVGQIDFSPVENALTRMLKQQEMQKNYALQQERMGMDRERFGMEQQRFQDDRDRRNELGRILDPSNPSFRDVPPQLVELSRATRDPGPIVQHYVNSQKGTDDIKEFEYARRQGFQGQFSDWMAIKRKGAEEEYNKNLVYGTDERGNIVPMQAGTKGNLVASKLPPGVALQRDPIKFDAGDRYILLDPTTRQPIGAVPKNIAAVEEQKVAGETRGKAVADLPRVIDNAQQALDTITQIREHPGKKFGLGIAGVLPAVPGTPQAGFVDLVNQAKGRAFLEAFNSLKGGGAITEVEGTKATQAIARLERGRSPQDFDRALADLEVIIQAGLVRAYRSAGRQPGQPPAERVNSGPGIPVAPQQAAPPARPQVPLPKERRAYPQPPAPAVEELMRSPSPQMKAFFDEEFGPGSADAVLKGRR